MNKYVYIHVNSVCQRSLQFTCLNVSKADKFTSEYISRACSPNLVADINHLERIQISATRYVIGIRHLFRVERLQRLGLHSLQRCRLWADLVTAFKIFTALSDIDTNLLIPLPTTRRRLRGHPYKVLQGASHERRRGLAFSLRVVKY